MYTCIQLVPHTYTFTSILVLWNIAFKISGKGIKLVIYMYLFMDLRKYDEAFDLKCSY